MVDVYTTQFNKELPIYMPVLSNPMAWKVAAFQHPKDNVTVYDFPPFALSWQVLNEAL